MNAAQISSELAQSIRPTLLSNSNERQRSFASMSVLSTRRRMGFFARDGVTQFKENVFIQC